MYINLLNNFFSYFFFFPFFGSNFNLHFLKKKVTMEKQLSFPTIYGEATIFHSTWTSHNRLQVFWPRIEFWIITQKHDEEQVHLNYAFTVDKAQVRIKSSSTSQALEGAVKCSRGDSGLYHSYCPLIYPCVLLMPF